ncbi:unnamed protein product [Mesocestoides corti]|uniref:DNA replication ATP-dependent helicase/nuclease n=1 Tax=Mesocestoides corti TaxID=53468 RepID=A0A158QVG7_MESCO|nr:unnamed protein product [Mesocestoides corti]
MLEEGTVSSGWYACEYKPPDFPVTDNAEGKEARSGEVHKRYVFGHHSLRPLNQNSLGAVCEFVLRHQLYAPGGGVGLLDCGAREAPNSDWWSRDSGLIGLSLFFKRFTFPCCFSHQILCGSRVHRVFGGSLRQTSLMGFVRQSSTTESGASGNRTPPQSDPSTPTNNDTSIILGTPEASACFSTSISRPSEPLSFVSSTGAIVTPPLVAPKDLRSPPRRHQKPRRSSFVTQRHAFVAAKREAEGNTGSISRQGNYDGLNYAPMYQNPVSQSGVSNTFASQRARRMAQLAAQGASRRVESTDRPSKRLAEEVSQPDRSFVFDENADFSVQPLKSRKTSLSPAALTNQENDVLGEVLNAIVDSPVAKSQSRKLATIKAKRGDRNSGSKNPLQPRVLLEANGSVPDPPSGNGEPHSLVLSTSHLDTETQITVELSGTWTDTPVQAGDIINLVPGSGDACLPNPRGGRWRVSDDPVTRAECVPPLLILHPDVLISGTTVAASSTCIRRYVMQHLWAENDLVPLSDLTSDPAQARVSGSQLMLAGSIIHEVFQTAVRQRVSGCRKPLDAVLSQSLFTPSKILQLYAMDATAVDFCESLEQFLPLVDRWVAENCIFGKSPTGKPTLKEVLDVEENIWCTKIGVKGKIDMTVVSRAAPEDKPCLIPLELKTGKPSFSVEHVGQVLLYLLMLSDRHADRCRDKFDVSKFGWLVYLHEGAKSERGLVKPQAASFRGLIQSRNQLAASLRTLLSLDRLADESGDWSPPLPRPVDSERVCSRCPYTLTCGVFRDDRLRPPPNAEVRELFDKRVGHISADHRRFLRRWTRLQLLEHASSDRVDNVLAQIASESAASAAETSTSGIRDLVIHGSSKPDSQNGFLTALKSRDGGSIKVRGMSNGDFLIVSSDDGRHIGLCLAFLTGLDDEASLESGTAFDVLTIRTDRPLPSWVESFRLDRCISDKTVQINLSNLVGLMADSPLWEAVRSQRSATGNTIGGVVLILTPSPFPPPPPPPPTPPPSSSPPQTPKTVDLCLLLVVPLGALLQFASTTVTGRLREPAIHQLTNQTDASAKYLRPLNVHQRKAILSVLMSKDYTLIEGFPGSGEVFLSPAFTTYNSSIDVAIVRQTRKTETLAALLRCLCLLQKRTLLISHTHSAVDNVLLRLTKDSEVRFVRLGAPDKVNPLLRPYNLESRLSETISSVSGAGSVASECSRVVAFLETTMSEAVSSTRCLQRALASVRAGTFVGLEPASSDLEAVDSTIAVDIQRAQLTFAWLALTNFQLGDAHCGYIEGTYWGVLDKTRSIAKSRLLKLVVGSTALAAGGATSHRHPALARLRFDVVVVDEATQLSLPTVIGGLLCLDENSGQFVLIGDPNQLPPLVRSNAARSGGFATSLFSLLTPIVERNEATQLPEESVSLGSCRVQLRSQYRMNSRILHLANNLFYDGQMECASDGVATATLHLPPTTSESKAWLNPVLSSELGDSVVFLDTQAACNPDKAVSRGNVNVQEVDLVVEIVARLTQVSKDCLLTSVAGTRIGHGHCVRHWRTLSVSPGDIGVIAPYRAQVESIQHRLRQHHGGRSAFEVNTVDQYQGRDKSVIIVSFTNCLHSSSMDHQEAEAESDGTSSGRRTSSLLNERPRLNVALTRAKQKLILIGCAGHSRTFPARHISVLEEMLTVFLKLVNATITTTTSSSTTSTNITTIIIITPTISSSTATTTPSTTTISSFTTTITSSITSSTTAATTATATVSTNPVTTP